MAEVEHQAVAKRQRNPSHSLKHPERQAVKVTTEKWRRFIDFIANSGYKVQEALDATGIKRDSYNVFVLTDQAKRDQVADAKVTYSRRYWTDEILDEIWLEIANGGKVREVVMNHASALVDSPINSFYALCTADVTINDHLKAARRIAMENMADEIIEMADDDSEDTMIGPKGLTSNPSAVRRAETKIRTRQWLMSKLYSDQYGDRPQVEINNNVQVNHIEVLDSARKRMEKAHARRDEKLGVVSEQ